MFDFNLRKYRFTNDNFVCTDFHQGCTQVKSSSPIPGSMLYVVLQSQITQLEQIQIRAEDRNYVDKYHTTIIFYDFFKM